MSKMDPAASSVTSNLRVNLRWIAVVLLLHLRYPTGLCSVVQPETRSVVQNDEISVESVTSKVEPVLGTCWFRIDASGQCSGLYRERITKSDCCSDGQLYTGWTPYTIENEIDYFQYAVVGAPASDCEPCKKSCEGVNCSQGRVCRLKNGRPHCVCDPDCSKMLDSDKGQVCAFDGRTYSSHCSLLRYNCRFHKQNHVDYVGRCQYSCSNVVCSKGKHCIVDQNGLPHCIHCVTDCPDVEGTESAVCGGDGNTYLSFCHLQRYSCLNEVPVRLAYLSTCRDGATCANHSCGDDKCLMDERTSIPHCVDCNQPCYSSRGRVAICGSNNVTYSNYCEMFRASCSRGILLKTAHFGSCGAESTRNLESNSAPSGY